MAQLDGEEWTRVAVDAEESDDGGDVLGEDVRRCVEAIATWSATTLRARGSTWEFGAAERGPSLALRFSSRVAARSLATVIGDLLATARGSAADAPAQSRGEREDAVDVLRRLRCLDALSIRPPDLEVSLEEAWRALEAGCTTDAAAAVALSDRVQRLGEAVAQDWNRRQAGRPMESAEALALWGARVLASSYGALLGLAVSHTDGASTRRDLGAFFTPVPLVRTALSSLPMWTLDPESLAAGQVVAAEARGARICDPACGAGAFLLEMAVLVTRSRQPTPRPPDWAWGVEFSRTVHAQIYGVDVDEHAIDVCAMSLWLAAMAPTLEGSAPWRGLRVGNALLGVREEGQATHRDVALEARKRLADEAVEQRIQSFRPKPNHQWERPGLQGPPLVHGLRVPVHWELEFPEVFTIRSGDCAGRSPNPRGFDYVVGNPPFVDSERMTREYPDVRAEIARCFVSARGNWDLFVPFVELAFSLLRQGGVVSYVLPRVALAADYAAEGQALLLSHTLLELRTIQGLTMFEDARVHVCVITAREGTPGIDHQVRCARDERLNARACTHTALVPITRFSRLPKGFISLPLESEGEALMPLLDLPLTINDVAVVSDGATTKEAYELRNLLLEWSDEMSNDSYVRLVNTGTIDPFRTLWSRKGTRYLGRRLSRPILLREDLERVAPRRAQQAMRDGVVLAGLARQLEAAVAVAGVLCGKSTVQLLPEASVCPYALAAWLNSGPIRRLYRGLFAYRGFGEGAMNIGPRQVRQLPVPERRWLRDAGAPVDGEGGEDTGLSTMGRRITKLYAEDEQAELGEQLESLDRLVREILARVAR